MNAPVKTDSHGDSYVEVRSSTMQRLSAAALGICAAVGVSIAGWALVRTVDHGERIVAVETSRYTSTMAEADQLVLANSIARLADTIAAVQSGENPPMWIMQRFEQVDSRNARMEDMLGEALAEIKAVSLTLVRMNNHTHDED